MNCPHCRQTPEPGAAFCGNCGFALPVQESASPFAAALDNQSPAPAYGQALAPLAVAAAQGLPLYALATPGQHAGEIKAVLSLILGVIGMVAAPLMAAAGLGIGMCGIVLGTLSRSSNKHKVSTAGIILSCTAVLASLAASTYAISQAAHQRAASTSPKSKSLASATAVSANGVTTPCYSAGFDGQLNIANANGSCDIQAYDGSTLDNSTSAYKVYGYQQPAVNAVSFAAAAKAALEKDVHDNLPGFTIDRETTGQFAGSPAYILNASNPAKGVRYVEAAVLHPGTSKNNLFIFVHASTGKSSDLSVLESQWQWK